MNAKETDTNLEIDFEHGSLNIAVSGELTSSNISDIWHKVHAKVNHCKFSRIKIDAADLKIIDSSGAALLGYLHKKAKKCGADFELEDLNNALKDQLEVFLDDEPDSNQNEQTNFFENVGKGAYGLAWGVYDSLSFIGSLTVAFCNSVKHPKSIRWKDVFITAELSGVNSFWICATIGTLFGLILAFQSADSMKDFGAEIYVATLVSLSLFRVLGPFIAAVLFAARSGSAFAAEIGTMKVNEEIDALITMGLEPISFLAVPRVLSGLVFVPLLTLFVNLFGLVGMFIVMFSFGYSFEAIYQQTTLLTDLGDFAGGIFKAMVFGILVAAVGCLRGMQTTSGSQAVGQAATKAVVSGIVLVVIAEGIFSVIFSILGI